MEEHARRASGGGMAFAVLHEVRGEICEEWVGFRGDVEDGLDFCCCGGKSVGIVRLLGRSD